MHTKLHRLALFVLIAGIVAGCVPSWHPLYTDQDIIFDSQLIGTWTKDNGDEVWKFEKDGENKYKLTHSDNEGKSTFEAHLVQLKDRRFLDLYIRDAEESKLSGVAKATLVPAHLFLRVDQIASSLKMAAVNPDWVANEANLKGVAHLKEKDRIMFTAETKDLQAFVLKHAEGETLFGDVFTLDRQPAK